MLLFLEWSLVCCVVLTIWSMNKDLIDRNLVSWIWILLSRLILSFITASLSSCPRWICLVVLSLPGLNRPAVWPVQTQPHSLGMVYTPEVSGPKSSFTSSSNLEVSVCGRRTYSVLCLDTIVTWACMRKQPLTGSSNPIWWREGSTNMSVLCLFHVHEF